MVHFYVMYPRRIEQTYLWTFALKKATENFRPNLKCLDGQNNQTQHIAQVFLALWYFTYR